MLFHALLHFKSSLLPNPQFKLVNEGSKFGILNSIFRLPHAMRLIIHLLHEGPYCNGNRVTENEISVYRSR